MQSVLATGVALGVRAACASDPRVWGPEFKRRVVDAQDRPALLSIAVTPGMESDCDELDGEALRVEWIDPAQR